MDTHKQEIDFKLMKYRINSLKEKRGGICIYLDKDKYGHPLPTTDSAKFTLSNIKQISAIEDKVMKITFEMEFVNE